MNVLGGHGKESPLSVFSSPLSDLPVAGSTYREKERIIYEYKNSTQNNNSTASHRYRVAIRPFHGVRRAE
jgi:hypothetical protein